MADKDGLVQAGWCGHFDVDLVTWCCFDCDRPLPEVARRRLENAPTVAPEGSVWVLTMGSQEGSDGTLAGGTVLGVFHDRSKIARLLLRGYICGAETIRAVHWYQGAYNETVFEGWEEGEDDGSRSEWHSYYLELLEIDHV